MAETTLPTRTSWITTALVGIGLLCCVYLAALKLINVPCPLTGCGEIINSRYGAIHGIPLPVFAIPLWIILALPAAHAWQSRVQFGAVLLLASGGVVLMGIQFLVLKGFCPFCTLHAASALVAAFILPFKGRAHGWLPAVALALALPLLFAVKESAEADVRSWETPATVQQPGPRVAGETAAPAQAAPSLPPSLDKAAFNWLGPIDPKQSPILVVSFQCSHCLDLLEQTLRNPQFGSLKGPKLFVYAQPHDAADSIAVIAAVLSVQGSPEQQFAEVFGRLDELRDPLIAHDSKQLRSLLAEHFPQYTDKLAAAKQLFNLQVVALKFVPGKGSPYLLLPDGSSKYGVVPIDLLFH
jgi:uncharacterized membrane protein